MPLPQDFTLAIGQEAIGHDTALDTPFIPAWEKAWAKIADAKGLLYDGDRPTRKLSECFPEAVQRYRQFKNRGGFDALKELFEKGTEPNFILRLLIQYFWNKQIPRSDFSSSETQDLADAIKAIEHTRAFYHRAIKHHYQNLSDERSYELVAQVIGAEPNAEFEKTINRLGEVARKERHRFDTRSRSRGQAPNDKANRVIFTICEYVRQTTGGPLWRILLDLFVAADLVKRNVKKRRTELDVVTDNPDRRVDAHLKSFKKFHPKEARFISEWLIPNVHPVI